MLCPAPAAAVSMLGLPAEVSGGAGVRCQWLHHLHRLFCEIESAGERRRWRRAGIECTPAAAAASAGRAAALHPDRVAREDHLPALLAPIFAAGHFMGGPAFGFVGG